MLKKIIKIGWIVIAAGSFITACVVLLQDGFIAGKAYVYFIISLLAVIILLAKKLKPKVRRRTAK